MANFEATVTLACSQDAVFDFLIRPANLQAISPPDIGMKYLSFPEILELGSRLEFELGFRGWRRF